MTDHAMAEIYHLRADDERGLNRAEGVPLKRHRGPLRPWMPSMMIEGIYDPQSIFAARSARSGAAR
jgi:hypothetical protein